MSGSPSSPGTTLTVTIPSEPNFVTGSDDEDGLRETTPADPESPTLGGGTSPHRLQNNGTPSSSTLHQSFARKRSHSSDSSTQTRTSSNPPTLQQGQPNNASSSPTYPQVNSPTMLPPHVNNLFSPVPSSPSTRNRQSSTHPNHIRTSGPINGSYTIARRHPKRNQPSNESLTSFVPSVPPAPAPAMYWSKIRTHGKSPCRALRAHTVNLVGELMYVFGGCDARTCFNNLYIFDADTMYWCKPKVNGEPPPVCRAHSSTLVDRKLFIFGGGDGPVYFNSLYIFDTDTLTWIRPETSGNFPSPRRAHTTAYYKNCIYVFGGGDGARALNDVYVLNISDMNNLVWQKLEPKGRPPISRGYHTSNLVGSKLVVYGGSDGHECFRDVHILDLEKNVWTPVDIGVSYPRLSHTATQVGSYLFVICGHDGNRYTSDVLLLNLVTMQWETRKIYGSPPSNRGYHTAVLHDSRLFVFGGYDGHSVFDDVFVLDLSACAYLPQITNFQLPPEL